MDELGIEILYIELIEKYPCENNDQLRAREGHFIREMATLNGRVEGRDRTEHYQDNKEDINQKTNKVYHDNIEARREQHKENANKHKKKADYDKLYRERNEEAVSETKKDCDQNKKNIIYNRRKPIMKQVKKK